MLGQPPFIVRGLFKYQDRFRAEGFHHIDKTIARPSYPNNEKVLYSYNTISLS